MWTLALVAVIALLSVIGYFTMIDVKPDATRPVLDQATKDQIAALERRLVRHVAVLASEIGELGPRGPMTTRPASRIGRGAGTIRSRSEPSTRTGRTS